MCLLGGLCSCQEGQQHNRTSYQCIRAKRLAWVFYRPGHGVTCCIRIRALSTNDTPHPHLWHPPRAERNHYYLLHWALPPSASLPPSLFLHVLLPFPILASQRATVTVAKKGDLSAAGMEGRKRKRPYITRQFLKRNARSLNHATSASCTPNFLRQSSRNPFASESTCERIFD